MKSLDKLERYDVLTFDEDDKVVVLARYDYIGRKFVYVNEILPDESDVTDIYKVMEIHLEDSTLEKVVDVQLLQELLPRFQEILKKYVDNDKIDERKFKIIGEHTYEYFYNLIDRLIKWQKKEEYSSLDIIGIYVSKDYEKSTEYCKSLVIGGLLGDSDHDIERFINMRGRNQHPNDIKFSDDVFQWFEIGNPYGYSSYMLYQSIGVFKTDEELLLAMQFLESDLKKKYADAKITFNMPEVKQSGSCYIATAVYGSYDCPQVWTLRRFRDNILANNFFGRVFIRAYYATSPTLVKYCGNTTWFQKIFRRILNSFVLKLKGKGIEDTPYDDR